MRFPALWASAAGLKLTFALCHNSHGLFISLKSFTFFCIFASCVDLLWPQYRLHIITLDQLAIDWTVPAQRNNVPTWEHN